MSIKVKNISKSFKTYSRDPGLKGALKSFFNRKYTDFHALKNINLNIGEGEILGILGENGAGKTTLIKLMVGLLHPTDGNIKVNNYTPWDRKYDFLKMITVVMGQKNQLWWDIPASESFLLNKRIYQIDDSIYNQILNEMVELLDVKHKLNTQVRRLSLGERMKMEIIASLLHRPKIIMLDEPTLGLDVMSQSKIREFVKYYNQQYNATFIITSHYMNDIDSMCKRVFVMNKGEGLYDGDFSDLVKKINPTKKLIYTFDKTPSNELINNLRSIFDFKLENNILIAQLDDKLLNNLLKELFKVSNSQSFVIEDLPVEETMRSFFENPQNYL
ncbi:MAG: multidrug ABC transporter ATP-binding protein [Candidatus Marinimicrobia bacterium]|nr:multidrug ABC transporter ATP-binding protein [Candidatus Neomarinimicrobiota bacterium]|tara:strand:- start:570 stop:1559 length:990 start_codon:yes stop_codon:yes gene_type:complete